MAAAARYGWRAYWDAPREERAAMVVFVRLENAVQVMSQFDQQPLPKPK